MSHITHGGGRLGWIVVSLSFVLSLLSAPSSNHHHHHNSCYLRSESLEAEPERIHVQVIYWGSALRGKQGVGEARRKTARSQARQSPRLNLIPRAALECELQLSVYLPKARGPGSLTVAASVTVCLG